MSDTANSAENLSGHTLKNFIMQVTNAGISLVVTILLTPYLIHTLGVVAYGLVPLAITFTNYAGVLIQSFVQAIARFLMIDVQEMNYQKANRTFNTAIIGSTGILLVSAPVIMFLAFNVPSIFNVPEGQSLDSSYLFLGVLGAFFIDAWASNFNISMFVRNRLDIWGGISIVQRILQVTLIVTLFSLFRPGLGYVGLSYIISSVIIFWLVILAWKRLTPQLTIRPRDFDRESLRDMGGMATWNLANQVGMLLFLQIDLILVNLLFGNIQTSEYAVVLQISVIFRTMAAISSSIMAPITLAYYANHMYREIVRLSKTLVKLLSVGLALPIGLLCGFASEVLSIWLGADFVKLVPLLIILIFHLVANLAVLPLENIVFAFNKLRAPGLVILGLGVMNIPLAVFLSLYMGLGVYGVAISGAITFTLNSTLFLPWYSAKIIQTPYAAFLRPLLAGFASFIGVIAGVEVIKMCIPATTLESFIFSSMLLSAVYVTIAWFMLFDRSEREMILHLIPDPFNRVIPDFIRHG